MNSRSDNLYLRDKYSPVRRRSVSGSQKNVPGRSANRSDKSKSSRISRSRSNELSKAEPKSKRLATGQSYQRGENSNSATRSVTKSPSQSGRSPMKNLKGILVNNHQRTASRPEIAEPGLA